MTLSTHYSEAALAKRAERVRHLETFPGRLAGWEEAVGRTVASVVRVPGRVEQLAVAFSDGTFLLAREGEATAEAIEGALAGLRGSLEAHHAEALAMLDRLRAGAAVAGPAFYWDHGRRMLLPPAEERGRTAELLAGLSTRAARRRWRRHARRHWEARAPVASWSLSGSLLAIRRDAWDRVGPFDEGYRLFFEETDWCLRAARGGWKNVLHPEAKIIHHQGQTVNRAHVRKRIEYTRSLFLYFKKNHPALSPWLRLLFPVKNVLEVLFSVLAAILTLGLSKRARRRLVEKWGTLAWQLRGCPLDAGLRPAGLRVPPGRESLRPRETPVGVA